MDEAKLDAQDREPDRRGFLEKLAGWTMTGGLVLAYGTCGVMAARYLYPSRSRGTRWQFVVQASRMGLGDTLIYRSPAGERVTVARQGTTGDALDFIALSSTCPHLGCQVRWEPSHGRFLCPCHNGTFDSRGVATAGPPFQAGQSLARYPLRSENGLLFIDVPLESIATLDEAG